MKENLKMNLLRLLGVVLVALGVVAGGMVLRQTVPPEAPPELLTVEPQWVPEGFELVTAASGERGAWKVYEKEGVGSVTVERLRSDSKPLFLNAEGGTAEKVTVRGREGILTVKGDAAWALVPLPETDTALVVAGHGLSTSDVLKIAEEVAV